jgi:hypothetical protein
MATPGTYFITVYYGDKKTDRPEILNSCTSLCLYEEGLTFPDSDKHFSLYEHGNISIAFIESQFHLFVLIKDTDYTWGTPSKFVFGTRVNSGIMRAFTSRVLNNMNGLFFVGCLDLQQNGLVFHYTFASQEVAERIENIWNSNTGRNKLHQTVAKNDELKVKFHCV